MCIYASIYASCNLAETMKLLSKQGRPQAQMYYLPSEKHHIAKQNICLEGMQPVLSSAKSLVFSAGVS
jgi:hypothetical protein